MPRRTVYRRGLGIGYGLRQIIDAQTKAGAPIKRIMISGGAGHHDLIRQLLADAAGIPVIATRAEEPVSLGAAILGAVAVRVFADKQSAMAAMSVPHTTFTPA